MGKPIRQRPGETACPATPFLTASDPSAGLLNRLADLRQAVPECLLLHVGCRSRPPPALRTVNIPSPRLPHPATSQIYRGQGLALPSPCLSSLVRPARYIPSVDSGLGNSRMRDLVFWCLLHLANLVSGAVFCSWCINPRLSRKMRLRARICATYGRSVRAGAWLFPNYLLVPANTTDMGVLAGWIYLDPIVPTLLGQA